MTELDRYIADRCHRGTARVKLVSFVERFRATLTPRERREWPRKRIVAELTTRGLPVARGGDRCLYVGGISLDPIPQYTARGGRLVLA